MIASQLQCQLTKRPFTIGERESQLYAEFGLPLPAVCPEERARRLLAFRNSGKYFWRESAQTGRRVISSYSSSTPFPVVAEREELVGKLDPRTMGAPLEPGVSFFQQLYSLWSSVPRTATSGVDIAESVALQHCYRAKRCVLVSNSAEVDSCMYSDALYDCSSCVDGLFLRHCLDCYDCVDCRYSRGLFFSEHCTYCSDSLFLSGCEDCHDCVLCVNLSGARYCILNKQVSEEEYRSYLRELRLDTRAGLEAAADKFSLFVRSQPEPHIYAEPADRVSGNYLYDCRDAYCCFECEHSADIFGCASLVGANHCLDGCGIGGELRDSAQFVAAGLDAQRLINCINCCDSVSDLTYCFDCEQCSNCLGCVGLRGAEFCILNMQYDEAGYRRAFDEVRSALESTAQWGCFPTYAFSSYAYNNSAGAQYMPVTKVQAAVMHLLWDDESEEIRPSELLGEAGAAGAERYSESFSSLEDLQQCRQERIVVLCELSGRPFQLRPEEIDFYERWRIAPPVLSFEARHARRVARLAPRNLAAFDSESGDKLETAFPARWLRPIESHEAWRTTVERNMRRIKQS